MFCFALSCRSPLYFVIFRAFLLILEVKKKSELHASRNIVGVYAFDSESGSTATSNLPQKSVVLLFLFFFL